MKRVKIAELKDRLSANLRSVERGAELVVTDRDRPIARIIPIEPQHRASRWRAPRKAFSAIRNKSYPPARWKVDSSRLLLEERRER